MKILFVNPHRSDFVYNSPVYSFFKRKSLRKYQYLHSFFNKHDTDAIFFTSSLVRFLSSINLRMLDKILVGIEYVFFRKCNDNYNFNSIFKLNKNIIYDVSFCFGFSISELNNKQLINLIGKSKLLIIHLSHYHIFANRLNDWASYSNVVFCADADITDNYFYNYFVNNQCPFFVLSYSIDVNRFKFLNPFENRQSKIICTGTFHEFEKIYRNSFLKINVISSIFGFLSIHPERRILYYFINKFKNIDILNAPMGRIQFFKAFRSNNSINQSKYFSIDIVDNYNKYKFSFVGEESIVGLPGIGIFESILCGCIPVINDYCYKGTPLEKSVIPIKYNNMNHLFFIIKNFEKEIESYKFNDADLQSFRVEVAKYFSESNQLNKLNKFLKIKN